MAKNTGTRDEGLTPKQARFVAEYLTDLNATQAAIRTGYAKGSADVAGCRLLANAKVQAAVSKGAAKRLAKAELTAERVLEEMRRVAFADFRGLFNKAGNLKAIKDLSDDEAAVLSSIEITREETTTKKGTVTLDKVRKVKVWDKMRALELLARHFALLTDHVHLTGDAELVERLQSGRLRSDRAHATR